MRISRVGEGPEEVLSLTVAGLGLFQRSSASTQRLERRASPGFPLYAEAGLLQGGELYGEVLHDRGDSSEDSGHFGLVAACATVERAGDRPRIGRWRSGVPQPALGVPSGSCRHRCGG